MIDISNSKSTTKVHCISVKSYNILEYQHDQSLVALPV